MKVSNLVLGMLLSSVFAGNAMAANKTRLMDTQGSGHSRFDLLLAMSQGSGQTKVTSPGANYTSDSKTSLNSLTLAYVYGVTDRFDIALTIPLMGNAKESSEFSFAGNRYKDTWKYDGAGDISLNLNYQLMNKQASGFNWNIAGYVSPSTASSTGSRAEVMVNGVVTNAGTTGKLGRGYTQTGIITAVGLPTSVGDVVFEGKIYRGGESSDAGVKTTHGSSKYLNVYLESAVNTTTTLTPYVGYYSSGSLTTAGSTSPSATYYMAGLIATMDISSRVSLRGSLDYSKMKDYTYAMTGGGNAVSTMNTYTVGLSSMFFF